MEHSKRDVELQFKAIGETGDTLTLRVERSVINLSTVFCDALDSNSSSIELTNSGLIKLWSDEAFDHMALLMRALNTIINISEEGIVSRLDLNDFKKTFALADEYNVSGIFHYWFRSFVIDLLYDRDAEQMITAYSYAVEFGNEDLVKHVISSFDMVVNSDWSTWSMEYIRLAGQRGYFLLALGVSRRGFARGKMMDWRTFADSYYKLDPEER